MAVMLALLVAGVLARSSLGETLERAHRVTQEASFKIGDTVYPRSSSVAKFCTEEGIKTSDLNPSEADFNNSMQTTTNKYVGPRAQLEPLLKSGGTNTNVDAAAAAKTVMAQIGFPILLSCLSILSAWFLFWWSLLECCCQKTCCMKEIKEDEPLTCGQTCIGISNVIVGLGLLIVLIIWAFQAGAAARGFKYLTCEMASLSSDLVSGVQYKGETNLTFIGLNGLSGMITKMKDTVGAFSGASFTKPSSLDTNKAALQSSFDSFYTKWSNPTNQISLRLNPTDASTLPDTIKAFDATFNKALRSEIDTIINYGSLMSSAYDFVTTIKGQADSFTNALASLQKAIDGVRDPVNKVGEDGIKALGIQTFQTMINAALIISLIVVISFLILFYFIAFMNIFKNKLHCLKFVNKLIMILKILLSIFLNIAAAVFVVVSIVVSNLCYFLWQASSDVNYTSALTNPTIKNMMTQCVLPTGQGDMTKLISGGDATAQIKKVTDISNTINSAFNDSLASNLTGSAIPPVGVGYLKTLYHDVYNGKADEFVSLASGSGGFASLTYDIGQFNSYMTSNNHANRMAFNGKCTISPASATTDAINHLDSSASSYCLQLSQFPANNAPTTGAQRYSGNANAGTMQTNYNKPLNTWSTYKTKVDTPIGTNAKSFAADFGFGGSNTAASSLSELEKAYMTNLVTAYNDFKTLRVQLSGLVDYLNAFSNNILSALNCKIIGVHIKQLQNVMCLKVGDPFINQTGTLGAFGFFIFLFPWCICCGIRCAPRRSPGDKSNQVSAGPSQHQEAAPVDMQIQDQGNVAQPFGAQPYGAQPYGAQPYGGPQAFGQPAKGYL